MLVSLHLKVKLLSRFQTVTATGRMLQEILSDIRNQRSCGCYSYNAKYGLIDGILIKAQKEEKIFAQDMLRIILSSGSSTSKEAENSMEI